jgi:hypothetical protein
VAIAALRGRVGGAKVRVEISPLAAPEPMIPPRRRVGLVPLLAMALLAAGGAALSWERGLFAAAPVEARSPAPLVQAPPPPRVAPVVAPVPEESPASVELSDAARKTLRRKLMRACDDERYVAAVESGRTLRAADALDWKAALCFAGALRGAGYSAEARAVYDEFVRLYPENRYADEARRAAAELRSGPSGS